MVPLILGNPHIGIVEKEMETTIWGDEPFRVYRSPIMENQIGKKMESLMETKVIS